MPICFFNSTVVSSTLMDIKTKRRHLDIFLSASTTGQTSEHITNMIVSDLLPLNFVEREQFKNLIQHLKPEYILPSKAEFNTIIEEKFKTCKEKMRLLISSVKYLAITVSLWSSPHSQCYASISACFINGSFKIQNLLLGTKEVCKDDLEYGLHSCIDIILDHYSIAPTQVVALVTDNGIKMLQACSVLITKYKWHHIICASHIFQTCVQDGFKLPAVKSLLDASRRLVTYFHHSVDALAALESIRRDGNTSVNIELSYDIGTDWLSTNRMLDQLHQLQCLLCPILADSNVTIPSQVAYLNLPGNYWYMLDELIQALLPLKAAYEYLLIEDHITISEVFPLVKGLVEKFSCSDKSGISSVAEFKKTLSQSLQSQFSYVLSAQSASAYHCATWLNPFHKAKFFKKMLAAHTKALIESEASDHLDSKEHECKIEICSPRDVKLSSVIENLFDLGVEVRHNICESAEEEHLVVKEISSFFREKPPSCDDILKWWSMKKNQYPKLHMLIFKYLCIPASCLISKKHIDDMVKILSNTVDHHHEALNILHCNKRVL